MTSSPGVEKTSPGALHAFILVAAVLFIFSYNFYPTAYDNDSSRLDLAFSLGLHGKLIIDEYHLNTIDKAFFEDHYYCDKAPGVSLAAAPVVAVLSRVFPNVSWHPDNPSARYPVAIIVIAVPAALSLLLLLRIAASASGGSVLFPVFVYGAGTLAMPYSTLFYGHQFCAILLLCSFAIWYLEKSGEIQRTVLSGIACGFLASFSVLTEYPAAVAAAAIILLSLISSKDTAHRIALIAGAAVPAIMLALYNNAAFGHPLHIGYFYEVNEWFNEEMGRGLGGVTFPRPDAIFNLLFQPHRGLFWGQPFLLLCFPGIYHLWRKGGAAKSAAALSASIFFVCLIINASYYEPYGGFSPGPRFLVWGLPFLAFLAAAGWTWTDAISKGLAAGAGIFSIAYYSIIRSVEAHVPHVFDAMLVDFTIPLLSSGFNPANMASFLGLTSWSAIIPVAAAGILFAIIFVFNDSRRMPAFKILFGAVTGIMALAVAFMASSLLIAPPQDQASYYRGTALVRNKNYESASEYLLEAVSINPQFQEAWYSLGIASIKNEEYNDAVVGFGHAVMLNPDSVQSHISLSAAMMTAGRADVAKAQLTESLKRFPGHPVLTDLLNKANYLLKEKKEPQ